MVVGGVYTLWSMRKTIAEGLSKAFKKGNDDEAQLRTEMDLPLDKVMAFVGFSSADFLVLLVCHWQRNYGLGRSTLPCRSILLLCGSSRIHSRSCWFF